MLQNNEESRYFMINWSQFINQEKLLNMARLYLALAVHGIHFAVLTYSFKYDIETHEERFGSDFLGIRGGLFPGKLRLLTTLVMVRLNGSSFEGVLVRTLFPDGTNTLSLELFTSIQAPL